MSKSIMEINKDHSRKRTSSWDTKISVCSAGGRPVGRSDRSDTPSSILSSDSDIRFTRKLGSQYRCGCCIIAGFLLLLLVAAVSVYLAYTFILSKSPDEKVFRVNFRVTKGDEFDSKLADPSTEDFRIRARNYKERLNLIFKRSHLRPAFLKTDILALDGNEDGDELTVHFNVHFDARRKDVTIRDLLNVLTREISLEQSVYLANLTIPVESLSVRESPLEAPFQPSASTSEATSLSTTTERPPRKCTPVQIQYCSRMPYNATSYPNAVGHASHADVSDDLIAFREIVDSECYHLAHDFVCHLLQPPCRKSESGKFEDATILPCRSYCSDFTRNCGNRIPTRFKDVLDCSKFPELSGTGDCAPKPGCVEDLHNRNLGARVCDGIIDCPDLSDEIPCSYCESNYLHCGVGRSCIHPSKRCDGVVDCPNGSDEKNCISLLPSAKSTAKSAIPSSHEIRYFKTGFVNFFREGVLSKLCMDDFNVTENEWQLSTLYGFANSLCRSASFERVRNYRIEEDDEFDYKVPYVQIEGNFSFSLTSCPDKNVLHLECENLECGLQSLRLQSGLHGLNKLSNPGDWPWHVALFKDNVHLCDGTLVSEDLVLTTASCFQGQKKAEWIALLGTIRLGSSSPWNQQRRIIGMIKSPVEGSSLVLVKMNEPITYSDFVRPVCLPDASTILANFTSCVALGWSRHNDQLLRNDVKISSMAKCDNISITTVNSICGESTSFEQDCNEEEFAGSPLLCLLPEKTKWILVGVSNWRIACQKVGLERPRLYDKTLSSLDWIRETLLIA